MGLTNLFVKFKRLYTTDLMVGTVLSVDAVNGTTSLTDINGLTYIALGTSVSAGNKAYVKDGQIQGQAPALIQQPDITV